MLGDTGWGERIPERYCPYIGHVTEHVVLLYDGSYMMMMALEGLPYELMPHADRVARSEMMDVLLHYIANPRLLIYSHLVRHPDLRPAPALPRSDGFGQDYASAYQRALLDGALWRNSWFLTLVLRPETVGSRTLRGARSERVAPKIMLGADMVLQLDDCALMVERTLAQHGPRRLGYRDVPPPDDPEAAPNRYSEVGSALHLIRTAHEIWIAEDCGTLGSAVYPDEVTVARNRIAFNLGIPDVPRIGTALGFKHYPRRTRPGMLNSLLKAPFPLVLCQSFHFHDRVTAHAEMKLQLTRMDNVDDASERQHKRMKDAMDAVGGNEEVVGTHNFTLLVFAPDLAALNHNVAEARGYVSEFGGANVVRERRGLEGAYWSVMPGITSYRMRKGRISSIDFCNLSSFEGYPAGQATGYWGAAIKRFRSNGRTAYDLVTHVDDVGHWLLTGGTGTGKTTFMGDMAVSLGPVMGRDGLRLMFDKDQSSKLSVEAEGGRYVTFRRHHPSGVAPLLWPATPENQGALFRILKGAIERDGRGRIAPDEEHRLGRGIARQFRLSPEKRTMAGIREFMGYSDPSGAGARIEPYCRGGALGWLLDNDEHLISLEASPVGFYGFDLTELLPKAEDLSDDDGCTGIIAAVVMHELRPKMDGRRIAVFADESRFLLDPLGDVLEDAALTGRKNELMVWMACQHPGHILNHPRGSSIVGQMRTKASWHDPNADDLYVTGLGYSPAALRQIKREMGLGGGRRVLIWRDAEPVVLEYDLSPLPDYLAVLSGRSRTVRQFDKVKADLPSEGHTEHYREFIRRVRVAREAAAA